jgi:hypothetical protein
VRPAALALLVTLALGPAAAGRAYAQYKDSPEQHAGEKVESDPLRGSIFIFDQSITTQTARLGLETPQSYVPYYGWWLSLRPRWWFTDELRLQGRVDYTKEFTNEGSTTYRDEDVFGDVWTDLVYQRFVAKAGGWKNTKVGVGARAKWPTSKESQANGVYVTPGVTASVNQKIPIRGESAPTLESARVALSFTYWHPFTNSTTPTAYDTFAYLRQDLDERSFDSHQIAGQTLVNHTLWAALELGMQVTPKLDVALYSILVNQWHYSPSNGSVATATGPVAVSHANDQQFTQLEWILFVADYEIIDELSVGVGYYNLQNVLAADGTLRTIFGGAEDNFFWGPDAHIFVDLTANLDKLFEDASGKYKSAPGQTSAAARAARTQRIAGEVR